MSEGSPAASETVECTCSCNCGNRVTVATFSPVLAAHARCTRCREPEHMRTHPRREADTSDAPLTARLTPIHTPSTDEVEASREARDAIRQEIWDEAWNRWLQSLPEKFRDATTEHPRALERLALVQRKNFEVGSLLIVGELGRGKTWIGAGYASDIIRRRILHPSQVLFGTEADLLTSVANSPFSDVEKEVKKFTSGRYRLIVIDDVGRGNWLKQDARPSMYWHVINEQYKRNNLVVLTTNLSKEDLAEWIGRAAYDRLRSMTGIQGGLIHLGLGDEDQRGKTTQRALDRAAQPSADTPASPFD